MQPIQSSNQHYVIKEDQSQLKRTSITSYLEIIDTNRLDSALFTCTISNPFGTDICNIQLIVQGMFVSIITKLSIISQAFESFNNYHNNLKTNYIPNYYDDDDNDNHHQT